MIEVVLAKPSQTQVKQRCILHVRPNPKLSQPRRTPATPLTNGQMQGKNLAMGTCFAAHPACISQLKPMHPTCKPDQWVAKGGIAANGC